MDIHNLLLHSEGEESWMKKLIAYLAIATLPVLTVLAFVVAPTVVAHPADHHYSTQLHALNNSGVVGTASLDLRGDTLTVTIVASGLEPNQTHMQHIHAIDHGNSTCPPPSADTDGDGIVSFAEGLPFFGPVRLPLTVSGTTYPFIGASGTVTYTRTFTVDPKEFLHLQTKAVVLHGLTVGGAYQPSVPVACGQIQVSPGA
jgi:hypothetical protein